MVVPTRNRSRLLAITLQSILWQRNVELEVIVVEDASTDDTAEMVVGMGDPRITLLRRESPQGPSTARNAGASRASGEWLAFCDDDDLWAPDKLARQVDAATSAGRAWAYVGSVNVGSGFEVIAGRPPPAPEEAVEALRGYNAVPGGGSNVIVRSAIFKEIGGFDDRFPPCEDWELWIRLARAGPPASEARPLLAYRIHGGNSSLDTERILRATRLIEQVHHTHVDRGLLHRWLAESALRVGRREEALRHMATAAARGEVVGVAGDLLTIARRRAARLIGKQPGRSSRAESAWIAEASGWLQNLQRLVGASGDGGQRDPQSDP
ncbi:MAG TPA: glycosyltransferase family A protein [Actinomycetota bacterium]